MNSKEINKGAGRHFTRVALIMQKIQNKTEVLSEISGVGQFQSSTNNLFFCAHCAAVGQMASCLFLENVCPVCMN